GQIRELRLRERLHDARELGQLIVVLRHRETPEIAHDEQRMCIDGVRVKQVVLHAPDDAPERGYVAPEHAVEVHAAQLVRDADRRAQDLEEKPVIARMLTELLVDVPEVSGELTN